MIIHKDCDPKLSKDKTLPKNSFLVSYYSEEEGQTVRYDIVQSSSQVEVFDKYWDEYGNVISIEWTTGIVDPKVYGYTPKDQKKNK